MEPKEMGEVAPRRFYMSRLTEEGGFRRAYECVLLPAKTPQEAEAWMSGRYEPVLGQDENPKKPTSWFWKEQNGTLLEVWAGQGTERSEVPGTGA